MATQRKDRALGDHARRQERVKRQLEDLVMRASQVTRNLQTEHRRFLRLRIAQLELLKGDVTKAIEECQPHVSEQSKELIDELANKFHMLAGLIIRELKGGGDATPEA